MSKNIATKTAIATAIRACECSKWEIGNTIDSEIDGGQPEFVGETTGCSATTTRTFAPGHDAKLKALLISGGVQGLEIVWSNGGVNHTFSDAATAAAQYGFASMVQAGVERGKEKAAARKTRKATAPRAPKVSADERAAKLTKTLAEMPRVVGARVVATIAPAAAAAVEPVAPQAPAKSDEVQIKVGRWEYAATIDAKGDAHYTNAKGVKGVAVKGVFKLV